MTLQTCTIVGTGKAAHALGAALRDTGMRIASVAGRDPVKVQELSLSLSARACSVRRADMNVDLVLLCVTDTAIQEACDRIAGGRNLRKTLVAHASGGSPLGVLDSAVAGGARVGILHPISALAGGPARLNEIVWGVRGGDEGALADLTELVERMGGVPLDLTQVELPLYHLSAIFAANFSIGVFATAVDLWERAGVAMPAQEALIPLVRSVLDNWEELGLDAALTGPIARGDPATVARQLGTIAQEVPSLESLYRGLALATTEVASRRSPQGDPKIAEIRRLLAKK